jgi:hypothetical protein
MKANLANLLKSIPLNPLLYITVVTVLLSFGVSTNSFHSTAYANAPEQVCNNAGHCVNRKGGCTSQSGTCSIVEYNNDDDNNEFAAFYYINPCNSSPADEVTQTCPFTEGYGLNSANAGDYIVQIAFYNTSGGLLGCIGTNTINGNAVLAKCNGANGSGGAAGTIFVLGGNNSNGFASGLLASRYWTNIDLGSGAPAVGLIGKGVSTPISTSEEIGSFFPSSVWRLVTH